MQTTLLAHLVHAARSLFEVQEPDVWELAMALAVDGSRTMLRVGRGTTRRREASGRKRSAVMQASP